MRLGLARIVLGLAVLLLGQACDSRSPAPAAKDLAAARDYWLAGEYVRAEQGYQQYLQHYPQGADRLEAWRRLADIALFFRGDPAQALTLFEAALLECPGDTAVTVELGALAADAALGARQYAKAAQLLRILLDTPALPAERQVWAYLKLDQALVQLQDLPGALAVLGQCRQSDLPQAETAPCSLRLAALLTRMGRAEEARPVLLDVYGHGTIAASVRAQAGFALGEAAEARHDKAAARMYYESVRETYPNPLVIGKKLEYLGK